MKRLIRDESPDQGMLSVVQQVLLKTHMEVLSRYAAVSALSVAGKRPEDTGLPNWDVRLVLSYLRGQVCLQPFSGPNNGLNLNMKKPRPLFECPASFQPGVFW